MRSVSAYRTRVVARPSRVRGSTLLGMLRQLRQTMDDALRCRAGIAAENGGTCDDDVDTRRSDLIEVVEGHTPVDLDPRVQAALPDPLSQPADLGQHRPDQHLASEARVDRHDQDVIDVREYLAQG